MASSPQFVMDSLSLQQNDILTLVIITSIVYDYILTFPREIDYIWNKPWTLVSTLYILIRYLGLCAFMILALWGSSFMPGPANVSAVFQIISLWATFGFQCAVDLMMTLRVWAMYNRSKIILRTLLTLYVVKIIPSTIGSIIYSNQRNFTVTTTQLLDLSFCKIRLYSLTWDKVPEITQLVPAAVMCILVIIQFTRESLEMYKVTKQWGLNQFMNVLVMEGVLYFLMVLMFNLMNILYAWGSVSIAGWQITPIVIMEAIPMATLTPRFILGLRELYVHNVQKRSGSGIDSGFGLSVLSQSGHGASRSVIVFPDAEQNEGPGIEHGEVIPMEERTA